jgi:mannonate dehydratase
LKVLIKNVEVFCTAPEGINLIVVKISTNQDGLFGLGCATYAYRHLAVKLVIEEYIKPLILGRDAFRISEIWQLMHQNAYWRNGPISNSAISGIDMALWDIKGKVARMPVYDLLGGKVRDGVPIYRHADGNSVEEVCANIQKYMNIGVKYIRCQIGGYGGNKFGPAPIKAAKTSLAGIYIDSRKYMRDTLNLFEGIREKIGFEIELVHDIHERIAPSDAVTFFKEMEAVKPFFLEDPVSIENLDTLKRLRDVSSVPIAIGELFNNPHEWRKPIVNNYIDFTRIHLSQVGGITPSLKIANLSNEFGINICWHGPGDISPIAHSANIHIDLAAPNLGIQEWSGIEPPNSIIQELGDTRGALKEVFPGMLEYGNDGYVYANEKPGLGIDFDEKEAAKYPCKNTVTTWTQTRRFDGSLLTP